METPHRTPFPVLPAVLVTGGIVILFGGFLACWFTAEDFTFIYLYHRIPFLQLFTEPNLKAVVVTLYRPVTDLVIYLEAVLFGGTAWPWHLVNLGVHLANVYLLYRLGRRLAGETTGLAAAFLYAWHPVLPGCFSFNVGGVQVGFLVLFTLLALDRLAAFRLDGRRRALAWSTLFLFLALGSYEWFVLPAAVFLFDLALPAGGRRPAFLRRCMQHLPFWVGLAFWLAARKAVLGTWLGGYPLPPPALWPSYLARIPAAFLASLEEFGFNPAVKELTAGGVRLAGRGLFLAVLGAGFARGVVRHGRPFLRGMVLLLLAMLAASVPVALVISHDPASARRFLLPVAFLCLFTAYGSCAAPRGPARSARGRVLPLALALLLACWWGGLTRQLIPWYLHAGKLTRQIRDQVLTRAAGPDFDPRDPVFLLHTPMTLSVPWADRPGRRAVAKVFQFGLSMAFCPPFCERALRVYPLNPDPVLGEDLDVPFMLYMWGEGVVLRFDEETEQVRRVDFALEKATRLARYMRRYCRGEKRPALLPLLEPVQNQCLWMDPEKGFFVAFPHHRAEKYRVVILNRHYPCKLEYFNLASKKIPRITRKMLSRKRVGRGYDVRIPVKAKILLDALVYFDGDPMYLWLELVDERGRVFHRTELVRFRLKRVPGR